MASVAYRNWAAISSSCSRQSGRGAEFALTEGMYVMLRDELRGTRSSAKLTKQAQEILSGSTILQLLSLVLDQLRSDFMSMRPVLPELHYPRTFIPLHHPG